MEHGPILAHKLFKYATCLIISCTQRTLVLSFRRYLYNLFCTLCLVTEKEAVDF